jgi:hypothetical protein
VLNNLSAILEAAESSGNDYFSQEHGRLCANGRVHEILQGGAAGAFYGESSSFSETEVSVEIDVIALG